MSKNESRTPRGPHGPKVAEHAKDFGAAIKRLFHELNSFKVLIIVSITLAALGSVLAIFAPNQLSKLTDEISEGLVINKDNFEKVTKKISGNLDEERLKTVIPEILSVTPSDFGRVLMDSSISKEDMELFNKVISDKENMANNLSSLPDSVLSILFKDTTYDGIKVSVSDKIALVRSLDDMKDGKKINLPSSIQKILFPSVSIDGVKISSADQYKFLTLMSSLDKDASAASLYGILDDAPSSIKSLVEPFMDMSAVKGIALFLACLYIISAIFSYIEAICMTNVSNNFARTLRNRISKKINKLPLKYFDKHQAGDTLSRVTNDVDTIAMSMNQSLATLVSSVTLFVGTIIMMFVTNWILALTAIGASLFGFAFMSLILKNSQKHFIARQENLGALNGHIEEIYSGLNVVKSYNGKKESSMTFDELNSKLRESSRKSQFLSGLMFPIMGFIGNFGYVAVCIVGAVLTVNDIITFGVIVAFISYVRLFTSPLSQIAQAMTSLQSTAAASERVFEFIDEEEMLDESKITKKLAKEKVIGNIEFDNVTFKYDGNEKPTINNFTASAKSGQKIAIVGPTGAGKTTMVNLLMKFYEINGGDIRIDGVSTKELSRENIHELFTMVLQDTWLFEGTIRENIIYNRENVSLDKVKEVCSEVGLDHFIKTLPNGYDSLISDNDSVSAGQRQLLTIARGMIEDSPFLILDEATSNVDTRTEELVQEAMDKLTKGKTSFIIAHRLSTIRNADLILVMNDGNIIEQGNHDELMKKNGFYADLYNSQFEL